MSRKKNYIGAAGELRAASELALRGYVTHLPSIDEGGDLYVVVEDSGATTRVQVKTSASPNSTKFPGHIGHQVNIKGSLLQVGLQPEVVFVVHCLHGGAWRSLVMKQSDVLGVLSGGVPAVGQQKVWWIVFDGTDQPHSGGAGGAGLSAFLNNWNAIFPVVATTGTQI